MEILETVWLHHGQVYGLADKKCTQMLPANAAHTQFQPFQWADGQMAETIWQSYLGSWLNCRLWKWNFIVLPLPLFDYYYNASEGVFVWASVWKISPISDGQWRDKYDYLTTWLSLQNIRNYQHVSPICRHSIVVPVLQPGVISWLPWISFKVIKFNGPCAGVSNIYRTNAITRMATQPRQQISN